MGQPVGRRFLGFPVKGLQRARRIRGSEGEETGDS